MEKIKLRIPIYKNGVFEYFKFIDLSNIPKDRGMAGFSLVGDYEAKQPELFTGVQDFYENDLVKVVQDNYVSLHRIKYCNYYDYPAFDLTPDIDCDSNTISYLINAGTEAFEVYSNIHENKPVKLTIEQWADYYNITVLDPDGFDRKNPNLMNEVFTEIEFREGLPLCTIEADLTKYGEKMRKPLLAYSIHQPKQEG